MRTDGNSHGGFGAAFALLRRRVAGVILCVIVACGAAVAVSELQAKKYTATASLLFNNNQTSQQVAGLQPTVNNNQQSQQDTNVALVQIGDIASRTAVTLRNGMTEEAVRSAVTVSPQGDTTIVKVSATATSPTVASRIANTYSQVFVSEQQVETSAYYRSALATTNRQIADLTPRERVGAQGLGLQERAQSLATLAQLRAGVQVAETASLPTGPSSPRVARNGVVGAILGVLAGILIAVLLERFDHRIREPSQLAGVYGLPLLGVVPKSPALTSGRGRHRAGAVEALTAADEEAFQLIRVQLRYFNIDRSVQTLLVVSAAPGDGKTTVSRCLASVAAIAGSRVLLIETDLRQPELARRLGLGEGPGLCDILIGESTMQQAIVHLAPNEVSARATGTGCLDVLSAGGIPPNPAELLQSSAMELVLHRAREQYDLVVVDTPPLAAVSDAFPLLTRVDGVVLVGWVGRNRREVAERLADTLSRLEAPLLGVIANGTRVGRGASYGYTYPVAPPGETTVARPPSSNTLQPQDVDEAGVGSDAGQAGADGGRRQEPS